MSHQPQQNPNPERRFMNLSVGMLAVVVAAMIVLPVVACLLCCALGPFIGPADTGS